MIDLLELALRDGWTFAGCAGLLLLVGLILWAISCALAVARPFQGIVQVNAPYDSFSCDRTEHRLSVSPSAYVHNDLRSQQEAAHAQGHLSRDTLVDDWAPADG